MPFSLTAGQKEYLEYIKKYISDNEHAPSLKEIAYHFSVKPPTAIEILKALEARRFIKYGNSRSGYYIILCENAGEKEEVVSIPILGRFNLNGLNPKFPEEISRISMLIQGAHADRLFGIIAEDIIQFEGIIAGDIIIFERLRYPLPNDICLYKYHDELVLIKTRCETYDSDYWELENTQNLPIPEALKEDRGQKLYWSFLTRNFDQSEMPNAVRYGRNWVSKTPISRISVYASARYLFRELSPHTPDD